ncbi:MAG: Mrp/NBP35 family ATP-binding protein [Elusimicrobiota bacterium]
MPTKEQALAALKTCIEPELDNDIVSLNMVRDLKVEEGKVSFNYVLTTPACPMKNRMEIEARTALEKVEGVTAVEINMTSDVRQDMRVMEKVQPGIRNLVTVGSGKGGVGKSSIASNLAVCLALEGAKVGLLDADVYGPNQPQMFRLDGHLPTTGVDGMIEPAVRYGVKVFSMGFLMETDTAAIWRGPMLHSAIQQMLKDVRWGELDYLIVDLPPGTGDVQLSLCQSAPVTGALLVTTPQSIALSDVRKAVFMFNKLKIPILGVVENMSQFICPHCNNGTRIFAHGGARELFAQNKIPFLGEVPLDPRICESSENGEPQVLAFPDSESSSVLRSIARQVAAQVSLQNFKRQAVAAAAGQPG